jgi:hypothetical protein
MTIFRLLTVIIAELLWSCLIASAASQQTDSTSARYRFAIIDRPQERKFVLTVESLDSRPLCIAVEKWPNRAGQLHFGSVWVKLESSEGTFPARDENFGYCVGPHGEPCLIQIAPGSVLKGSIGYEQFGDPTAIAKLSKRHLKFPVSPSVCKAKLDK